MLSRFLFENTELPGVFRVDDDLVYFIADYIGKLLDFYDTMLLPMTNPGTPEANSTSSSSNSSSSGQFQLPMELFESPLHRKMKSIYTGLFYTFLE
jgi:hypothetical protein